MKRLVSLLCALCLLFSLSVAEAYEATNPYTIENIGMTIDLPEALNVTSCEVGETSIDLRLGYNGRNDVSYAVMITYDESLEDYVTITLPEENLQAMIDYYQSMYTGGNPGLVAYDKNDGDAVLTPFCAGGQGEDGNMYCIFVCVLYGYTITVVGGTSADSFDDDTYGAAFNLYWSTVTSFVDCMTEELADLCALDESKSLRCAFCCTQKRWLPSPLTGTETTRDAYCQPLCALQRQTSYLPIFSRIAACAAARRAIGTRKGEQET